VPSATIQTSQRKFTPHWKHSTMGSNHKLKHADECNFIIHSISQIKDKLISKSFPSTNARFSNQKSPPQHPKKTHTHTHTHTKASNHMDQHKPHYTKSERNRGSLTY